MCTYSIQQNNKKAIIALFTRQTWVFCKLGDAIFAEINHSQASHMCSDNNFFLFFLQCATLKFLTSSWISCSSHHVFHIPDSIRYRSCRPIYPTQFYLKIMFDCSLVWHPEITFFEVSKLKVFCIMWTLRYLLFRHLLDICRKTKVSTKL